MKRLVLETVYIPQFDWYAVRIVEQTHRGNRFGTAGESFYRPLVSPVRLCSISYPQAMARHDGSSFYVRGDDVHCDNEVMTVKAKHMDGLRKIVKEYNREFSAPTASVPPNDAVERIC